MAATLVANRLSYLMEKTSLRSISRQTGISYTQVWRYSKGLIDVPSGFDKAIRNTYQRTVYNTVRDIGMSTSQARRFSWMSPESASRIEKKMSTMVDMMTEGSLTNSQIAHERRGLAFDRDAVRQDYKWSIQEGLRNSDKTLEEWENYFSGYHDELGIEKADFVTD